MNKEYLKNKKKTGLIVSDKESGVRKEFSIVNKFWQDHIRKSKTNVEPLNCQSFDTM